MRLGASLPEDRKTAGFQNVLIKKLYDGQSPKRKMCQLSSVMLCPLVSTNDESGNAGL